MQEEMELRERQGDELPSLLLRAVYAHLINLDHKGFVGKHERPHQGLVYAIQSRQGVGPLVRNGLHKSVVEGKEPKVLLHRQHTIACEKEKTPPARKADMAQKLTRPIAEPLIMSGRFTFKCCRTLAR